MTLYVNGQAVSGDRIEQEIARMRPAHEKTFADQPDEERQKQLADWARENVIESVLFEQAARQRFADIADAEIDAFLNHLLEREDAAGPLHQRLSAGDGEQQKLRQEAAAQIRTDRFLQTITAEAPQPKDKDIRRYYDRNIERFSVPEMVRAAHIVKHPDAETSPKQQKEQLEETLAQIRGGADFAELAQKQSACPDNGGDLGYFQRGQMVQAFEDAVFDLKPGQISDVFATEFGWHIAKLIDRRPAAPCPFEQVRELIVKELTQQEKDKALERFLDQQREKAVIEER